MTEIQCSCSRKIHRAPLEGIFISSGAIYKLPDILKAYKKIYLVADERTYDVAGRTCEEVLSDANMLNKLSPFFDTSI